MTNEELIRKIRQNGLSIEQDDCLCELAENIKKLEEEIESQRWIPVTERLPEHDNVYLTYDLHGGLSMMEYHTSDDGTDYYGKGFYSADENGYMWKDDKVTHWLSIQKPPKEEST